MVSFLEGIQNEVFNGSFLLYTCCGWSFGFFFFSELNDAFCCVVLWTNGLVKLCCRISERT